MARFQEQLSAILDAVSTISELDLSDVPPTSHPLGDTRRWRDDVPAASLDRAEVLAHAPGTSPAAGLFKVPKVL